MSTPASAATSATATSSSRQVPPSSSRKPTRKSVGYSKRICSAFKALGRSADENGEVAIKDFANVAKIPSPNQKIYEKYVNLPLQLDDSEDRAVIDAVIKATKQDRKACGR